MRESSPGARKGKNSRLEDDADTALFPHFQLQRKKKKEDARPPAFPRLPAPRGGPGALPGSAPPHRRCCRSSSSRPPLRDGPLPCPQLAPRRLLSGRQRPRRRGGGGGARRGPARPPRGPAARPAAPEPSAWAPAVARGPPGQLDVGVPRRDKAQVSFFFFFEGNTERRRRRLFLIFFVSCILVFWPLTPSL